MKAKVKFDSAQVKTFLLHHVEKVVFGGFVVAFLLISWYAFKLKPYGKTPDQLKATADRVSQDVEKATPPDKFADLPSVPKFSNLGAAGLAAVDPRPYRLDPINRPYEDRQELRKEPKFYALEELMAFAGYGGIATSENGVERVASGGIGSGMGSSPNMGGAEYGMMSQGVMNQMMQQATRNASEGMHAPSMPTMTDDMRERMSGRQQSGFMPPGMGGGRQRQARAPKKKTAKKVETAAPRPKPQATEKIVLAQPPAGAKVEGRYWVCLVGAIPYRKQFVAYQETFRDARGYKPEVDYPRYNALPEIERAEVIGEKLGEWHAINVEEAVEDLRKWAAEYPEIVDKQFLDPHATEPLPALIFANHDKAKVNHPRTQLVEEKPKAAVAAKKRKITSLADQRRQGSGIVNIRMDAYATGAARLPEYRLFRFFDFSVKPGKTYRYRVKLALVNPNHDAQRRYLENYAFGDGATRESDWSQPSEKIAVIAGNRLLAGGVAVSSSRSEPTGSVLAKLFDSEQAIEVRKVFDVHRGSVLNQRDLEIGLPDPEAGPDKKTSTTVNLETDAVVLDMFGGEKLAGGKSSTSQAGPRVPGHLLVLDNDGEFKTLMQASDSAMFETESEEAKNQAPPKEGERRQQAAGGGGDSTNGFDDFGSINSSPRRGSRKPAK